jgi:hypothetical protein
MAQTIFVHSSDEGLPAQTGSRLPALACDCLVRAICDGPGAGSHAVSVKTLTTEDITAAVARNRLEHARIGFGMRLVPMDAGAIASCASYRCLLLLTHDPFAEVPHLATRLGVDEGDIIVRVHHALMQASHVITLGHSARSAVAPFVPKVRHHTTLPPIPLTPDPAGTSVLVVLHQAHRHFVAPALLELQREYPDFEFVGFDEADAFGRAWRAVVHIGPAASALPGARLVDAWAGGVPVLQLVDTAHRWWSAEGEQEIVDHGRTGLLSFTLPDLIVSFDEFLSDAVVARVIASAAQTRPDITGQWSSVAGEVLQ